MLKYVNEQKLLKYQLTITYKLFVNLKKYLARMCNFSNNLNNT